MAAPKRQRASPFAIGCVPVGHPLAFLHANWDAVLRAAPELQPAFDALDAVLGDPRFLRTWTTMTEDATRTHLAAQLVEQVPIHANRPPRAGEPIGALDAPLPAEWDTVQIYLHDVLRAREFVQRAIIAAKRAQQHQQQQQQQPPPSADAGIMAQLALLGVEPPGRAVAADQTVLVDTAATPLLGAQCGGPDTAIRAALLAKALMGESLAFPDFGRVYLFRPLLNPLVNATLVEQCRGNLVGVRDRNGLHIGVRTPEVMAICSAVFCSIADGAILTAELAPVALRVRVTNA